MDSQVTLPPSSSPDSLLGRRVPAHHHRLILGYLPLPSPSLFSPSCPSLGLLSVPPSFLRGCGGGCGGGGGGGGSAGSAGSAAGGGGGGAGGGGVSERECVVVVVLDVCEISLPW